MPKVEKAESNTQGATALILQSLKFAKSFSQPKTKRNFEMPFWESLENIFPQTKPLLQNSNPQSY